MPKVLQPVPADARATTSPHSNSSTTRCVNIKELVSPSKVLSYTVNVWCFSPSLTDNEPTVLVSGESLFSTYHAPVSTKTSSPHKGQNALFKFSPVSLVSLDYLTLLGSYLLYPGAAAGNSFLFLFDSYGVPLRDYMLLVLTNFGTSSRESIFVLFFSDENPTVLRHL